MDNNLYNKPYKLADNKYQYISVEEILAALKKTLEPKERNVVMYTGIDGIEKFDKAIFRTATGKIRLYI
jgi:hypothetical protein